MYNTVKYRIAARTEAAGKFNPEAPQEGNEDNYGLICNVANPDQRPEFDEVVDLGDMGLLMYVADGMGGHNAGEVASKIAVDTVSEAFSNGKVSSGIAASHEARSLFLEEVIREADKRIRAHSRQHKECEGMGSTLIVAWLVSNELTVSWCGDSRCYIYRPQPSPKIAMVSEDHSYVQELVQRGVIPYEATFAHPRGNIVTRCLGGGGENSSPESRLAYVGKGDIVMLCSDGLSGVLFDDGRLFDGMPISEENICDTIAGHRESLRDTLQALYAAAERQNWYDNVTAVVCEVVEGLQAPAGLPMYAVQTVGDTVSTSGRKRKWPWVVAAIVAILAAVGGAFAYLYLGREACEPVKGVTRSWQNKTPQYNIKGTASKYHVTLMDTASRIAWDTVVADSVLVLPKSLESGMYTMSIKAVCENGESRAYNTRFTHTKAETASVKKARSEAKPLPAASKVASDKKKGSNVVFEAPILIQEGKKGSQGGLVPVESKRKEERLVPADQDDKN